MFKTLQAFIMALMMIAPVAMAADATDTSLGDAFDVSMTTNWDNYFKPDGAGDYRFNSRIKSSSINLTANISKSIKAVLQLKIDQVIRKNGIAVSQTFDLEGFIKNAYVEIVNIGGQPIAVIIGKQKIPFSLGDGRLLDNHEDSLNPVRDMNDLVGFTVRLDYAMIGKIEVAVFENLAGKGDLDLGTIGSVAVRWSREVYKDITVSASYTHLGDEANPDADIVEIAGVYKLGDHTFYAEGMYFHNNPKYPNADFTVMAGYSYKLFKFGEVVAQMTYIHNYLFQVAAGMNFKVNDSLTVGPEVRWNVYDTSFKNDWEFGVRTQLKLASKKPKTQVTIFGKKPE
ncbi:MAG: hypothetical protein A2X86_22355 [Bdellovibrionales bacterium GWA2_49_15]|nr:MAG: hypothetical protein A2X86_22355 [Bdellovibrionales bacterium GWA2_49_15]HAZ14778.1 hypothetical protein [Bdellovibrionales bacterium]